MTIEKLKPTYTFTEDKLNQLKDILPEAFADGKINFETLKEVLAEVLEEENQDNEHFGLFWVGKRQARKIASIPSKGTLVPVKGEGIDEENTKNIFIEGDNLEVLKLLQKSYANKIKMIYIDPPYNTGNDFVYEDDFSEPIKEYLKKTGQVDEQGRELTTNKKSDGRFHAKWLSMMYPRLSLARNLLKDDGVIFISIDDNEVSNLKLLCNEIFGEENFISIITWQRAYSPVNMNKFFSSNSDYILVYSKNIEALNLNDLPRNEEALKRYKNPDNDFRGEWKSTDFSVGPAVEKNRYKITLPSGRDVYPPNGRSWVVNEIKFYELLKDNRIWFGEKGDAVPSQKKFISEVKNGVVPLTVWTYQEVGHTQDARRETNAIFDGKAFFDYPKPISLMKRILQLSTQIESNDIVLDFFAGSGTTGNTVLNLNKEDNGNRKFICVQIPEKTKEDSEAYNNSYKTISEITKERIRRSIKKIKDENEGKMDFQENNQDLGFKVFKLQQSNYKEWKDYEGNNTNQLEITFDDFASPLVENWKKDDLLSEIIIMEGFSLDSNIKILTEYPNNEINEIISSFCNHKLLICLDDKLNEKTIESLVLNEKDIFVCLDSSIDDNYKLILSDKGLIKTI